MTTDRPPFALHRSGGATSAAARARRHGWSLLLLAVWAAGCADGGDRASLASRVDALLAPYLAANELSGAVVLVRHGEVVYRRGFGMANREAGVAFTPDTPSDGGSLAKTFTAAGLWWLAQEGRIDLEVPVTRYLAEFPHAQTTVRQLISHSNGLPPDYEWFDPHFAADEVRTTSAMLGVVAREAPAPSFPPGSRFEYSNFAFDLAALVIERVAGESYEAFLRARFFERLGMDATFARPARFADWPGVRTLGYRWHAGSWEVVDVFDLEGFLGASNLYFSAADLARWAGAHAEGTALPPAVAAAGARRSLIDGRPSPIDGLSWYRDASGERGYYTGSLNAFHSLVYWDRERNEAAVLVSNGSLPAWRTITLQRDLVAALAGRPTSADPPVAFEPFDRETRALLSGRWVFERLGTLTVAADAERVTVRLGDGLEFEAFPVDSGVFYVPGPDHWLAFSGGRPPTELHLRSMFVDDVARRVP